mgnify:CR=1 FL=1
MQREDAMERVCEGGQGSTLRGERDGAGNGGQLRSCAFLPQQPLDVERDGQREREGSRLAPTASGDTAVGHVRYVCERAREFDGYQHCERSEHWDEIGRAHV